MSSPGGVLGPRAIRRVLAPILVLATLAATTGCGRAGDDDVQRTIAERLAFASDFVSNELTGHLDRAHAALEEIHAAFARLDDGDARFAAVEAIRRRHGLSGLTWSGPSGETIWAGRPVEAPVLPAQPPWHRSFRAGEITYLAAPTLRALVLGPRPAGDGHAFATLILETRDADDRESRAFEKRWRSRLDLDVVWLMPADAPPLAEDLAGHARRVAIRSTYGDAASVFLAELRTHSPEVVAEQLAERNLRERAWLWWLAWAGTVAAIGALIAWRLRRSRTRAVAAAGLALGARGALAHVPITDAVPALFDAFSPTEFAIEFPFGWLRSPADFALTSIAFLFAAMFLAAAIWRIRRPAHALARVLAVFAGLFAAGAACGGWHALVAAAVRGGKTSFFRADSFVPRTTTAFMLLGVVATTAAAFLAAAVALRFARRAWDRRGRASVGIALLLAAGASAVAWWLASSEGVPHVVVLALPLVASGVVVRDRLFGLALPSRILLVGVVATFLAYPLLWSQVTGRDSEQLARTLRHLLAAEESNVESMAHALDEAREDPRLRPALHAAARGDSVEGVAYHLWLRSDFRGSGRPCVVSVLDAHDHVVDRFSLGALPDTLLLRPAPPARADIDTQIDIDPGDGGRLRAVIGRARIRDGESALGTVVFTAPDRLDMEVRGLHDGLLRVAGDESQDDAAAARPLFAELRGDTVLWASDPTISRRASRFGPPELLALETEARLSGDGRPRTLTWRNDDHQGFAQFTPARGGVHAVRRARPGFGEVMLALSRVILLGVGLASVVALIAFVVTLRGFRPQLHHRILVSYFVISVIPLVLLGLASARDTRARFERRLDVRLGTDLARMRGQLERLGGQLHERADSASLQRWTPQTGHDTVLYDAEGLVQAASRPGLIAANLLSPRLPAEVYRATVLDRRRVILANAEYAGRPVWFGYEPVLDSNGRTRATVGIPLLYDQDRLDEEVTVSGSVLMAAYLLTLVLVLVGAIYAANRIARPLALLAAGTRRVASGDLDVELPGEGQDEMGQLVANFNAMTRELRETTARAVQAERESAWRKMARQVAHEIKNPLTPMRLMIQQMEAEAADPARAQEAIRRAAPVVLRQIETLTRIAGDFANFARLPKRRHAEIDPAALVEEVTALHSGTAAKGIAVTCDVERGLHAIYWDEEEMRRALINLVRNAIQAIEGRGVVRLKAFSAERDGKPGVAISVTDTGVGIPRENLERLFEPHFSTKTSGMGLGLAIVRRIVQDSGGTIRVASRVGRGTIFTLWWPTSWEGR